MVAHYQKNTLSLAYTVTLFPFQRNRFHYSLPRMINFSGQDWTWVAELWNYVIGNLIGTLVEAQRLKPKDHRKILAETDLLYTVKDSSWNWLLSFTLRPLMVFCRYFSTFVTSHSCQSSALHAHWCSIKLITWLTVYPWMPRLRDLQSVLVCSCHSDQRIAEGKLFLWGQLSDAIN